MREIILQGYFFGQGNLYHHRMLGQSFVFSEETTIYGVKWGISTENVAANELQVGDVIRFYLINVGGPLNKNEDDEYICLYYGGTHYSMSYVEEYVDIEYSEEGQDLNLDVLFDNPITCTADYQYTAALLNITADRDIAVYFDDMGSIPDIEEFPYPPTNSAYKVSPAGSDNLDHLIQYFNPPNFEDSVWSLNILGQEISEARRLINRFNRSQNNIGPFWS